MNLDYCDFFFFEWPGILGSVYVFVWKVVLQEYLWRLLGMALSHVVTALLPGNPRKGTPSCVFPRIQNHTWEGERGCCQGLVRENVLSWSEARTTCWSPGWEASPQDSWFTWRQAGEMGKVIWVLTEKSVSCSVSLRQWTRCTYVCLLLRPLTFVIGSVKSLFSLPACSCPQVYTAGRAGSLGT